TPIYGQIQSFGVTNVLVAVVRYFGGIKLGVSGLITAYKTTAQLTLESSDIIERHLQSNFELSFEYAILNKVMKVLKEKKADILKQKMEMNCLLTISIRKNESMKLTEAFNSIYGLTWKPLD
ncbi:MAG: IMPACT family protein, partial [Flavobacterium sp.]